MDSIYKKSYEVLYREIILLKKSCREGDAYISKKDMIDKIDDSLKKAEG